MDRSPLILGIDIGTGGCKVVAYNLQGVQVASAFREYKVIHPRVGWAEQNPEDWWRAAAEAIREVTSRLDPSSVEAIGVTSQREAFASLGKNEEVLYNAIIWLDSRASRQEDWVKQRLGARRVLEITGLPVDQMFSAVKLLWLKEEAPSIFSRINKILFAKDYISFKLTGNMSTDYSMASRTMLLDINKLEWSKEMCEELQIPYDILPPLRGSWEVVGEVSSRVAELTGLKKGTQVVAGGGDRPCEALGAGAIDEGEVNAGTGTGTCFEAPLSEPRPDYKLRVDTCVHVIPHRWEYEIVINATGESLRWFRDNLGWWEVEEAKKRGVSPYDVFMEEAKDIPAGSEGLLYFPYLWGVKTPFFNPKAKGVFIGFTHAHTRKHFVRAILEGVAYHYKGAIELLSELGVNVRRFTMTGGEVRGELWNQIKAAMLGINILIPRETDAASLGAAILAALGTRHYATVREAVQAMVHVARVVEPDSELFSSYTRLYEIYRATYYALEKAYDLAS
ncbi:MAG: xylulokinase [Thermofilaceae archaeon]|nr:xylulokinase [Thermofilaceae archaeon]MCX8180675.1 xylulokinase [Thermofilaceae archaeon]MDW8003779.1 xylulokinase [Thermofilaceae archaeon]